MDHHAEDVGRILLEVQKDLKSLRASVSKDAAEGEVGASLEQVLQRAEADLAAKAELVLDTINTRVKGMGEDSAPRQPSHQYHQQSPQPPAHGGDHAPAGRRVFHKRGAASPARALPLAKTTGEKLRERRMAEAILNPRNANNREILNQVYGVPAPRKEVVKNRPVGKRVSGKIAKERISQPNAILPRINRRDPQAPPPPIYETDINQQGVFGLTQRGFIPATVDMHSVLFSDTQGVAPVACAPMQMHHWDEQFAPVQIQNAETSGFNMTNVKLDLVTRVDSLAQRPSSQPARRGGSVTMRAMDPPGSAADSDASDASDDEDAGATGGVRTDGDGGESQGNRTAADSELQGAGSSNKAADGGPMVVPDDPRSYNELLDTYSLHQFIIRRGRTLDSTPEFLSYKRKNGESWGAIQGIIRQLERLFAHHAVPLAYIDGRRVERLAEDDLTTPTIEDLLSCVVNTGQVLPLVHLPGRRYRGLEGTDAAAAKIQATWRMYIDRIVYRQYRRATSAVVNIQRCWRKHNRYQQTLAKLNEIAEEQARAFREGQAAFAERWPQIRARRRVVIHIPSLSLDLRSRKRMPHFTTRENAQMSRLCQVADPNVQVIYVSPYPISTDVMQYYQKLLEIGGVKDPSSRYKIVYPENHARFPAHFSLSTVLLYSPRCLKRLRNFIRGKNAYIVPGVVGVDEVKLAVKLGCPLLGADPDTAAIFGSKSGAKRVFQVANVNTAPGAYDLDSLDKLVDELARLMLAHPQFPRWMLKLDDAFGGNGHAYLDTACVPSFAKMASQMRKDPEALQVGSDEYAAAIQDLVCEIREALPRDAVVANRRLYPSWKKYLSAFCRHGGVVEGAPERVLSSPSANVLVEPDGTVSLLSTQEQVFGSRFNYMGAVIPQISVPAQAMLDAATSIGEACYSKGIIGFVGIDFVSLLDPAKRDQRRLWAVDLNIRPTESLASYELFHFVTGGRFEASSGRYLVTQRGHELERFATSFDFLYHESLSLMHYNVLFSMCRSEGIAFDLQDKVGTAFSLHDKFTSGVFGMTCVGGTVLETLHTLAENLDFLLHKLGGAAAKQGSNGASNTNYVEATNGIKATLDRLMKKTMTLLKKKPL